MGRSQKTSESQFRKRPETVGKNVDINGDSGKVPDRNKEQIIAKWRKGDLFRVAKNLADCVLVFCGREQL